METMETTAVNWIALAKELGAGFEKRAADHDLNGNFVETNYAQLREHGFFSALVPQEFGGAGVRHSEMCHILKTIARHCGSTALALSMHQHLVSAAIWRFRNKNEAVPLLKKVAAEQPVLVSTGARDWLDSNGEVTKAEGGFHVSGKKSFASGSVIGDIAITSAPYHHPTEGWQVIHFPVPLRSQGVSVLNDWDVLGMRGTGSQTIVFDKVFVPEASIALTRPRTGFHPVWDVVLTVAMPLIMSVYFGLAEKAMDLALQAARSTTPTPAHLPYVIGKMNNHLVGARAQWERMISLCNDITFKPAQEITVEMLSLKTNVAKACIEILHESMEAIGGRSFYKISTLERLFRDVQAAQFHPLPETEQYLFTGTRLVSGSQNGA